MPARHGCAISVRRRAPPRRRVSNWRGCAFIQSLTIQAGEMTVTATADCGAMRTLRGAARFTSLWRDNSLTNNSYGKPSVGIILQWRRRSTSIRSTKAHVRWTSPQPGVVLVEESERENLTEKLTKAQKHKIIFFLDSVLFSLRISAFLCVSVVNRCPRTFTTETQRNAEIRREEIRINTTEVLYNLTRAVSENKRERSA